MKNNTQTTTTYTEGREVTITTRRATRAAILNAYRRELLEGRFDTTFDGCNDYVAITTTEDPENAVIIDAYTWNDDRDNIVAFLKGLKVSDVLSIEDWIGACGCPNTCEQVYTFDAKGVDVVITEKSDRADELNDRAEELAQELDRIEAEEDTEERAQRAAKVYRKNVGNFIFCATAAEDCENAAHIARAAAFRELAADFREINDRARHLTANYYADALEAAIALDEIEQAAADAEYYAKEATADQERAERATDDEMREYWSNSADRAAASLTIYRQRLAEARQRLSAVTISHDTEETATEAENTANDDTAEAATAAANIADQVARVKRYHVAQIYQEETPDRVTLFRVGDDLEAYGSDALAIDPNAPRMTYHADPAGVPFFRIPARFLNAITARLMAEGRKVRYTTE